MPHSYCIWNNSRIITLHLHLIRVLWQGLLGISVKYVSWFSLCVQDVSDGSAQPLVPVHSHDVCHKVPDLTVLRHPGDGNFDRILTKFDKNLDLVTGGAERKMGGESATFSTLMMNSWDARFLESLAPSTQAFWKQTLIWNQNCVNSLANAFSPNWNYLSTKLYQARNQWLTRHRIFGSEKVN